jgi:hypothetical protein
VPFGCCHHKAIIIIIIKHRAEAVIKEIELRTPSKRGKLNLPSRAVNVDKKEKP